MVLVNMQFFVWMCNFCRIPNLLRKISYFYCSSAIGLESVYHVTRKKWFHFVKKKQKKNSGYAIFAADIQLFPIFFSNYLVIFSYYLLFLSCN